MAKIILDPNLFECDENATQKYQMEHFYYLQKCICFLSDYCLVEMDIYQGAPYWYSKNPFIDPPITNSHYLKISYGKIKEKFQRIINKNFNEVEINKSKGNTRISELRFIDLSKCKDAFLKYIETQFYELENCILILGMERETGNIIVEMNGQNAILQAINNPPSDCTNIVVKILQSSGNDSELFPNKAACNSLNDSFKDEIKGKHLSDSEKIEIMLKYGGEFASRNHYEKNAQLTRNNPKRTVFENKTNRCAISIDREHGGIELFMKRKHSRKFKNGKKSSFIHKGEYSFSGDKIKSAEPYNHIIYD